MEVQNRKDEPETLEAGLDFWSRQEQKFQSLFGKEALKDREFLKMKLRHYDRLWYQYKNTPLDIEGQLMRNMLKFQRRKIDKSMYRGLLRQIIRRITTAIESSGVQKVQQKMENKSRLVRYNENSPKPEIHQTVSNTMVKQKENQVDTNKPVAEKTTIPPNRQLRQQAKGYSNNPGRWHKHKINNSNGIHH